MSFQDLILLDDFFESLKKIYRCNITGFQVVQHDPLMKSSLALTMDSVTVIGEALKALNEHGNTPIAESLICEYDDAWNDGELLNQAIRQVCLSYLKKYIRNEFDSGWDERYLHN